MITITETLYKKMPDDIKACFTGDILKSGCIRHRKMVSRYCSLSKRGGLNPVVNNQCFRGSVTKAYTRKVRGLETTGVSSSQYKH